MKTNLSVILAQFEELRDPVRAVSCTKFFKAFPGGYGGDDIFYGIKVPTQRKLSRDYYKRLSLDEVEHLLISPIHEIRLTALMMLVLRFQKSKNPEEKENIVNLYLDRLDYVNNWDLVDSSAPYILGPWLLIKPHDYLLRLAQEKHLWKQRVAVVATAYFIRQGSYKTTFELASQLLDHKHDLIHKAVGWMLREIGNRDFQAEYDFLLKHYKQMPRTMLRYAIEKFDEDVRQGFLKGTL